MLIHKNCKSENKLKVVFIDELTKKPLNLMWVLLLIYLIDFASIILLIIEKILNKSNNFVVGAILKYGYSEFTLEILEYCSPEKCIEKEQYYIDLLKPEYNILQKTGSLLGFKHSEET